MARKHMKHKSGETPQQRWARLHPDKVKKYHKKWAEKHPDLVKKYHKKWYEAHH